MWNVNANVILVISGETGRLSRSVQKYLDDISGKHSSMELQVTTFRGTATHPEEYQPRSSLTSNLYNLFSRSYYVMSVRAMLDPGS
jgi:hypothetical protein